MRSRRLRPDTTAAKLKLRALDPATLAIVAAAIESYRYDAGTALPYPDDPRDTVYLIGSGSGRVRVYRVSADGEAVTLLYLSAGDCLKLSAEGVSSEPRNAAVVAEHGRIYSLRPSRLQVGAGTQLAIARVVEAQLLRQILELCDRVAEMAFYGVAERTRRTLERLAGDLDQPAIPITQEELAALVGARREYMTRVLKALKAEGILSYHRKQRGIRLRRT